MFSDIGQTSATMDNLMKFLFLKLKSKNMPISETLMQKLIFKIKMELGEKHELYENLPYYWYIHGPFSEVARDSFRDITFKYCNANNNNYYMLKESYDDFESSFISNFPDIDKISEKIIKDQDTFYNDFIENIYLDYAPYSLMYPFKYQIYNTANEFRSSEDFNVDEYIDAFYECESELPEEDYFNNFSDIYSQLSTNLDIINQNGTFDDYWIFLRDPIKELWKTFVSGVRVNNKDNYYNYKTDIWQQMFTDKLKTLSLYVGKTEIYIDTKTHPNSYTSSQKRILNSTIGSYLRG